MSRCTLRRVTVLCMQLGAAVTVTVGGGRWAVEVEVGVVMFN